jgi:ADP-heptose:LPS heptosyltransferase
VRRWPRERFAEVARRLEARGLVVDWLPEEGDLDQLLDRLAAADVFIGNDSGPGHLAAHFGLPTFTVFGPQLPENFAPCHPKAAWIEGAPCPYKPCFDACRFPEPRCLLAIETDAAWRRIEAWLATVT